MDICLICLRTDRLIKLSNGLSEFHDELCGYTLLVDNTFYCGECEYLLTKFYKFKQKCLKASEIYRDWMSGEIKDPKHALHKLLPPSSLGVWEANPKTVTEIRLQAKTQPDVCNEKENKSMDCYSTLHELIYNAYNKEVKPGYDPTYSIKSSDDDIQNENDSRNMQEMFTTNNYKVVENDKMLTDYENYVSQNENNSNSFQEISTTKNRKALENDKTYKSMFNIEYLTTHEMKVAEFQRRKSYECYVNAEHKCEICYQVVKNAKFLKYHKDKWHNESPDRVCCPICKIWYPKPKKGKFKKHLHTAVYKCKLCPLVTYHRRSMENHFGWHEGKQYHCEECNVTYKSKSVYSRHIGQVHRLGRNICDRCGRGFLTPIGLIVHQKNSYHCTVLKETTVPEETESVRCEECDVTLPSQEVYDAHVYHVHEPRVKGRPRAQTIQKIDTVSRAFILGHKPAKHTCRVCNEVGTSFGWLKLHFKREHPTEDMNILYADKKTHLCDICGIGFSQAHVLRDHMNIHTGALPYACDICPKRYRSAPLMQDHRLRHFPATLSCTHCEKTYTTKSNLYAHMKVHTGERSYRCEICGKGFLLSASLNEHVRGVHLHIRRARKRDAETEAGVEKLSKRRNKVLEIEAIETSEALETETIDASEVFETETIDTSEVFETETIDTSEVFETETIDTSEVFETETIDTSEVFETETIDASEVFETEIIDASEVFETETIDASEVCETEIIDASEVFETETIDASEVCETEIIDASEVFETEIVDAGELFETEAIDASEVFETETIDSNNSEIFQT